MVGKDGATNRILNFEEHRVDQEKDISNATPEHMAKTVEDAKRNFGALKAASFTTAASGVEGFSLTADSSNSQQPKDILLKALGDSSDKDGSVSNSGTDHAASINKSLPSTDGSEDRAAKRRKLQVTDVILERGSISSSNREMVSKDVEKFSKAMKGAAEALLKAPVEKMREQENAECFLVLKERYFLALMLLGRQPKEPDTIDKDLGDVMDLQQAFKTHNEQEGGEKCGSLNEFHRLKFQEKLSALQYDLPVSNLNQLLPITCLREIPNTIKAARSADEISSLVERIEFQRSLIEALKSCVASAQKAVKTETTKIETKTRQEADAAQKVEKEKSDAASVLLRKRVRAEQSGAIFVANWVAESHTPVTRLQSDEELAKYWTTRQTLAEPLLVTCNDELAALLVDTSSSSAPVPSALKMVFDKWGEKAEASMQSLNKDKLAAPASAAHGVDVLDPAFMKILPRTARKEDVILSPVVDKKWFFAYSPTMIYDDFEPDHMGTIKMFVRGAVKAFLFPGKALTEALQNTGYGFLAVDVVRDKKPHELASIFVKTVLAHSKDNKPIKALKEAGVTVVVAEVSALDKPVVLVVPPGYFLYVKTLNMAPVDGIFSTFFADGKSHAENYGATCPSTVSIRSAILDMFKV